MWILCQAEDSHEMSSLILSENNENVFMNVVCCSRDWHATFKSSISVFKI